MMIVFYLMAAILIGLIAAYVYYRTKKQARFFGIDTSQKRSKIIILLAVCIIVLPCIRVFTPWPFVVLSAMVVFMLTDLAALICRHTLGRMGEKVKVYEAISKLYRYGVIALLILAIYFGYGIFNMNRIVPVHYDIKGDEYLKRDMKIVLIADTHYGTIQKKSLLTEKIKDINKLEPDIVILAGDITEEGTSNADMKQVYKELGTLNPALGTYYVYGNHDKQYYTNDKTYSIEEYENTIRKNGITILEDEAKMVRDDVLLVGRADLSEPAGRKNITSLVDGRDKEDYVIIADHQPNKTEAASNGTGNADLMLSGHTHGGQEFPIGSIMSVLGRWNYGEYEFDNMDIIVTSGFTGWGYPFRTQRHCEYAIIDVHAR